MSTSIQPAVSLRDCRVLVVDDDEAALRSIARILQRTDCAVDVANSVPAATARLSAAHYDLCLVDVRLGDRSGEDVVERALASPQPPQVVMMSGMATIDLAVRAMRLGAVDFLEKPLRESALVARLAKLVEALRVRRRLDAFTAKLDETSAFAVAPASPAMQKTLALADRVAASPGSPALITGESGVGKEVLATHIHRKSARASQAFVRVNVAAIPEAMMEAELFGSVRGAFTDSKQNRLGHIASADRGTLLLDEIGELRLDCQPKLLRALEERRFYPVGSDRERAVDVRFLAATNREPEAMLDAGILRRDLFYRLGVVIRIPPLRERVDEIVPLARVFLQRLGEELGRPRLRLSREGEAALLRHPWPGNVRELRNAIERAAMTCAGEDIDPADLELHVRSSIPPAGPSASIPPGASPASHPALPVAARAAAATVERQRILDVLHEVGGSRSRAAAALGVSRSTLYEKLKRYAIE